jgi:excisionase family DNA binding protein
MSEKLLTPREVAERMGRSVDFVRGLMARGRLHYIRISGRYYVYEWSLQELVSPPKSPPPAAFAMEIKPKGQRNKKQ